MNLRKFAKAHNCQVRIEGVCNHQPETVVLAHFRMNGIRYDGGKPPDILGAHCCSACHAYVDTHHDAQTQLDFAKGVMRTIALLVEDKILKW